MITGRVLEFARLPVVSFLLLWAAGFSAVAQERKPNVIVILADDLGYADVGFNGCEDMPTPALDEIAGGGARCTQAYACHPVGGPTRAGILTGVYPQKFGFEYNPKFDRTNARFGLPTDQKTLAEVLKAAGYATAAFGKWHLGAAPELGPPNRGFDAWLGFLGAAHHFFKFDGPPEDEMTSPVEKNIEPVKAPHLLGMMTQAATRFMKQKSGQPFFMYLAYNVPRRPFQPRKEDKDALAHIADAKRREYAAMVRGMDWSVGQVLARLKELGLERDTLIFFTSDNGAPGNPASSGASNAPLSGGKGDLKEGGIRVPFAARWPAGMPAGVTYQYPVSCLDIFATAVSAAGVVLPEGLRPDGVNLLPHLSGKTSEPPHPALYWRVAGGKAFAVRVGAFKLLKMPGSKAPTMFDVQNDPGEVAELFDDERLKALQAIYEDWASHLANPTWEP